MNFIKKIKKQLLGYPFVLGLLTSVLINFGGLWMVKVRELALSEVSYTIVAKSSSDLANPDTNNNDGSSNGVNQGPML